MLKLGKLIIAVVVCQLAGIIGAAFTTPVIDTWYSMLVLPSFAPPNWLFGPVWTILYLLMGIALYLVWIKKDSDKKSVALKYFAGQLLLNLLWSLMFFGLQSPVLGFTTIVAMWMMIALTIKAFLKVSQPAGWLLVPYLLWVSFATILNTAIMALN